MAEVSVSVIGKDMLSASFRGMQSTVASLAGEITNLSSRAISPVTVALGNLLSDVVTNGVNALKNLKGTIESFNFIKLNMEMEMTRASFTTLLKSGTEANKMLDTLRIYANQTPFEFTQLTAATRKMLAFGFSAKEITTDYMGLGAGLLDVVGNASSALGAGAEGIQRITRALGQMRGLARVSAEDMNQLIDVGVQGYQILAEQLGMTVKEVREAMKKGGIDAEVGIKALLNGMMQQYGGGMQSFSQTAEGMSSTLNDYLADIQRGFGQIAYKEYRLLLTDVTKLVGSPAFTKFANMLGVQFGGAIKRLNDNVLKPAIQRMTQFVNTLGATDAGMQNFFDGLMRRIEPVTSLMRNLGLAFGKAAGLIRNFVMTFLQTDDVRQASEWLLRQLAKLNQMLYQFSQSTSISGREILEFARTVAANLRIAVVSVVHFIPVVKEAALVIAEIVKQLLKLNTTTNLLGTIRTVYDGLTKTIDSLVPRIIRLKDAIPAMASALIDALAPVRNVLGGFGDVLMSSGRFILEFIKQIMGLRQVQDAVSSIPDRLNQFADVLRMLSARIDDMTSKLPIWFDYLERLPNIIRGWIASIPAASQIIETLKSSLISLAQDTLATVVPLAIGYFESLKAKVTELIQSGIDFVMRFTLVGQTIRTVGQVASNVSTSMEPFIKFFLDLIRAALQAAGVTGDLQDVFAGLARGVEQLLAAVARILPDFNQMLSFFTLIANLIRDAISAVQMLLTALRPFADFLANVIRLFMELSGVNVSTIFTDLARVISNVLGKIAPLLPTLDEMRASVARLQQVFSPIMDAFGRFVTAASSLGGVLLTLTGQLLNFAAPFTTSGMTSALNWLTQATNSLAGFLSVVSQAATTGDWTTVTTTISTWATNMSTIITDNLRNLFSPENVAWFLTEGRANLVSFVIEKLGGIFTEAINTVSANLPATIQSASQYVKELIPNLITGIENSWNTLSSTISLTSSGLVNAFHGMWDTIQEITNTRGQTITQMVGNLPIAIAAMWEANKSSIRSGSDGLFDIIRESYQTTWEWIKSNIGSRDNFVQLSNSLSDEFSLWYRNAAESAWRTFSELTDKVVAYFTGPEFAASFDSASAVMGKSAEEAAFRLGVIIINFFKDTIKQGVVAAKEMYAYLVDQGPTLLAIGLSLFFKIKAAIDATIIRTISGLIQGILAAFGLTDWIPAVARFFDGLVDNVNRSSNDITTALNRFANWWRSLELGTMLRNFVTFVSNYVTRIMPQTVMLLAQMPGMIIDAAGNVIKEAMINMLTMIQNAIQSILGAIPGMSGYISTIQQMFQGWRDTVDGIGGTTAEATARIEAWRQALLAYNRDLNNLMIETGMDNLAGQTAVGARSMARSAATVTESLNKMANTNISNLAADVSYTTNQLQSSLSDMARTLMTTTTPMFMQLGSAIAGGIASGFDTAWASVAANIQNSVSGVAGMTVAGRAGGGGGVASITNVNNRSVDMNVTINQTTPTSTYDNLRYAQSLAQAKIF